jgi:hypothetical protein
MSYLASYVAFKNAWVKMLAGKGGSGREINLSKAEDLKYVLDCIECDLSPENLHCDGEISASAARAKYVKLMGAKKEAEKLLKGLS